MSSVEDGGAVESRSSKGNTPPQNSDVKYRDEQLGYFIKDTQDGYVAICEKCDWATDYKSKNRNADSLAIKHARRNHGLNDFGLEFRMSIYDFELPGLGDRGEDCGALRVAESNTICPEGDALRGEHLRCRRVECPDCHRDWSRERAFRMALETEAYAQVNDERPHALFFSVPPEEAETWDWDDINEQLFRQGYEEFRANESRRVRCDGYRTEGHSVEDCPDCYEESPEIGGYSIFHPARVKDDIKEKLRKRGYGGDGAEGGYWRGVREDVLGLGEWRNYAEFGPHVHNIGFPSYIQEYDNEEFIIRKYATLDELDDVVAHTRYLLSHAGTRNGAELGNATRSWGLFHHASEEWAGAEEELPEEEYHALAERVADALDYEWDREECEPVHPEEDEYCPEHGIPVNEFEDLWSLPGLMRDGLGRPWHQDFTPAQRGFFSELSEQLMQADYDGYYLDSPDAGEIEKRDFEGTTVEEIEVPESVTVFGVKPPPESDGVEASPSA